MKSMHQQLDAKIFKIISLSSLCTNIFWSFEFLAILRKAHTCLYVEFKLNDLKKIGYHN